MPQMAPYNWLFLFFIFNMIMIFFMSFNYFSIKFNLKNKKLINKVLYEWKW